MATGVGQGKIRLAAFNGLSPKPPYRRQNFVDILYKQSYSPFCPKFRCHGNQEGSGVKLNNTIRLVIPKNYILEPKIMTILYTAKVTTV